jgi:hypothetical protein
MTTVACFCGCLYSFDGDERPCPECEAVAIVRTKPLRETSENREPDAARAGAPLPVRTPVPSGHLKGSAAIAAAT